MGVQFNERCTDPPKVAGAPRSGIADEERSFEIRTQFLRRVAHDIASPTGVAMTVVEELAKETERPQLLAMARRSLRRLLRLADQLALVAELEGRSLEPEKTFEDLRSLVTEALDAAVFVDGRRDVVTACDLPDARLLASVDRRLLASILREVIGNALRLATARVQVELQHAGAMAIVRVHDDGPGFAPDVVALLGQRFTARSSLCGLGLSLSMAKEILLGHGGELTVGTSALPPGRRGVRGASVVLSLPCADRLA
jgi:signal transduction histidine kinase